MLRTTKNQEGLELRIMTFLVMQNNAKEEDSDMTPEKLHIQKARTKLYSRSIRAGLPEKICNDDKDSGEESMSMKKLGLWKICGQATVETISAAKRLYRIITRQIRTVQNLW